MALLNTGCNISTIQSDITGLTTGYAAECFAILAAAVDGSTQDRCVTVPNSGSLPNLSGQAVPEGQIVFVEDIGVPVIAASKKWIGFDKRILKNDAQAILYTWGNNIKGGLGDGTVTSRSSPGTTVGCGVTWCAVSAGGCHTAAIKTDGTLWTWGYNANGQLGDGTITSRSSPGTTAGGGTNWCSVSAASFYTAAIKTDGTLWTWGYNGTGQLGDGTTTSRRSPGTTAGGGTNWYRVSMARLHATAIKTDGTLWTWGRNNEAQLGDGTVTARSSPGTTAGGGTNWCNVIGASFNTAAIKTDGTLWTWGYNVQGQLGDGTTTSRRSPGTTAGGGTNWRLVSAGYGHTTALKTDGTIWSWGCNSNGQLGDGTAINRSSPVTVAGGGTTWCFISAGCDHALAIKTDGTLWSWGDNILGQLGDSSITDRSSPVTVVGAISTWCTASAGTDFSVGLVG